MRVYEINAPEGSSTDNDPCIVAAETVTDAIQAYTEVNKDAAVREPVTSIRDIGELYAMAASD